MELTYNDIHARLTSFYARNADLNLWLPATFVERYERGSRRELISCVATYTNWRRFDVDVKFAPR
jgi:cytidylate kinase